MPFPTVPTISARGPILCVGGPYSNREATEAILQAAARLGIPGDHVICTGDVVAYGADPTETVELVRDAGWHVVMGNCEESLAERAADCGCGFPTGSACERLSSAWFAYAAASLDEDTLRWMGALPRRIDVVIGGARLAVVHGGAERINQFMFASTNTVIKHHEIRHLDCDGVIAGHCGLPFTQTIGGKLWHNAGVIGMPANDGTPRVWYSLIRETNRGLTVEHRALDYDFNAAAKKMRRAGLPEDYAEALETGLWPNCDVLLLEEIRRRGRNLQEASFDWVKPLPVDAAPKKPTLRHLWPLDRAAPSAPDQLKFVDPERTLAGHPRASVSLSRLKTLLFNTGTICNIACRNCYIESSPRNDRLAYLTRGEVQSYLEQIERENLGTEEIGFTGGEPFLNPDICGMLEDSLASGFRILILTNAMRPMQRKREALLELHRRHPGKLVIRVSLDHFNAERHEDERGPETFRPTLNGLIWLAQHGFNIAVAGRTMWNDDEAAERAGYANLFRQHGIPIDANDPSALVLFPEMGRDADVLKITEQCWSSLGKSPQDVMCATSRMVVKRRGAQVPTTIACTLLPYDARFDFGPSLKTAAAQKVALNHRFCAEFCVLGGALCSPTKHRHT